MLRFVEELLILIIDGENVSQAYIPDRTKRYALAGAVLMELALENRIDTDVESLWVTDRAPLGDGLLDPALAEIAGEGDTRTAEFWVRRIAEQSDELLEAAQARLLEAGILETDDGGLLSLSRRIARSRRYPAHLALSGASGQEVQTRLQDVLYSDEIPSPRDSMLISLAHACDIFRQILEREGYDEVRERIELLARLFPIGRSVADAVRNLSLAESQALTRVVQERGGGWPRASGSLPVIGHTLKMLGDLGAFFTEQYLKHGPVFEVNALGNRFLVMAGREANLFVSREGRFHLRSREVWEGFKDELGAATLLPGMDGADHRLLRRTKRNGYSREFILERMPAAVAVVERELAELPVDRPVSVTRLTQRVTTEQIARLSAGASSRERIDDIITFNRVTLMVFIARRYPKFMMRTPRVKRARRRLELFIERVLHEHELRADNGEAGDLIDDLLELHRSAPEFLAATDMFIAAMGPFMVGLDTVASTTAFALYALLKHPDLLECARAEADEAFSGGELTAESHRQMTIIRGIILETLRMYPIGPLLPRTVSNSFNFAGHRIPAGTRMLIAPTVTHRLPEFFPEPERFDIDRYSPERRENAQRGVFVPFGLGHHTCLGQGFAEVQMALTIATLLHRAEIDLARSGYRLKVQHAPGPRPADNFKIRVRPRQ